MEEHVMKVLRRYGEMNWLRSNNVKYFNDKTKSSNDLKDEILQLHKKKKQKKMFTFLKLFIITDLKIKRKRKSI